jgi:hypothetical protein
MENNKPKFKFIDTPKPKKKKPKPPKEYVKKAKANKELYGIWNKFVEDYSKAYEYKLAIASSQELYIEVIATIDEMSNSYDMWTNDEEWVFKDMTGRPGWLTVSVRMGKMLRKKARMMQNELKKRNYIGFEN